MEFKTNIWKPDFENLPEKPGVYEFRTTKGKIIYIGKAKNLKKRVSQYYNGKTHGYTNTMIKHTGNITWHITKTEKEAIFLEASLIHTHKPKYNILLKDDKSFVFIKIGAFPKPRISTIRNKNIVGDKKSTFFGPFTNAMKIKKMIRFTQKTFELHSCDFEFINEKLVRKKSSSPCMMCYLNKNPNINLYKNNLEIAKKFLAGNISFLEKEIKEQIDLYAKKLEYEKANKLKNILLSIIDLKEKQYIISNDIEDSDFVVAGIINGICCMILWQIRSGHVAEIFELNVLVPEERMEETDIKKEIIKSSLPQFYISAGYIPKEINLLEDELELEEIIEEIGKVININQKIKIRKCSIGNKYQLLKRIESDIPSVVEKISLNQSIINLNSKGLDELKNIYQKYIKSKKN